MVGGIYRFGAVLGSCCSSDLAYMGVTMYLQYLNQKTQQAGKLKKADCKSKAREVIIPESWGLSETQRNFINFMTDKSSKA